MKNTKNSVLTIIVLLILGMSSTVMAGDRYRHDNDRDDHYDRHYDRKHDKHHQRHHDRHKHRKFGKVLHARPIYKTIRVEVPEQHCVYREYQKPVKRRVHRHNTGEILVGGVIGGIIGRELGRHHNQGAATVAGAVIGSTIAHNAGSQYYNTGEYRTENRRYCHTEMRYETERQLIGYRVKYRYKGDIYVTRMDHHPGKRIRISRHTQRHGKHRW